jgi:arylsulfatase A-like enzyme
LTGLLPVSLVAGKPQAETTSLKTKPNLIFIMADDLGYGDLGCYGQKELRTPNIDRMAAEGMKFTDFYAGSTVCAPSRCVLMTGKHLGHAFIRGNGKDNLRPKDFTVAELMKQASYTTGQFGKWGIGHEGSTGVPTKQGFDEFFGYLDQHHAHNYYPTFLVHNEERVKLQNVVPGEGQYGQGVATKKAEYSADLIGERLHQFLDENHDKSFFIYYPMTLPHANNEGRRDGLETIPADLAVYADKDWPERKKQFAAMVSRVDAEVGKIIAKLRKYGIEKNTLVIFTSDNGPHAEGGHKAETFDSNGPLRGTKRDLYEGGIRVPMLAWWPGTIEAGSVTDHVGYFGDLMMTCADLTGTRPPADQKFDSVSFLPTLLGHHDQQQEHEYLYWEFYEGKNAQGIRMGDWKGIIKPFGSDNFELYNLKNDLDEEHEISREHPEIVKKLKAAIAEAHVPNPRWKVPKRKK